LIDETIRNFLVIPWSLCSVVAKSLFTGNISILDFSKLKNLLEVPKGNLTVTWKTFGGSFYF